MLTIFAIPKPFEGHIAIIQRNAIKSWTLLDPKPHIIIFGDEIGSASIAQELNLHHIPDVATNSFGTPLVNDMFAKAEQLSPHNTLCYLNSDIILTNRFMEAIRLVKESEEKFLMVGQRLNLDITEPLDFTPQWDEKIIETALDYNNYSTTSYIDYFAFSKSLWGEIPDLAVGRAKWDNWMVYRARAVRATVVDATQMVHAVHQLHDHNHYPQGREGVYHGEEAQINEKLAGGRKHIFTIRDATHKLSAQHGLTRRSLSLAPIKLVRQLVPYPNIYNVVYRMTHSLTRIINLKP